MNLFALYNIIISSLYAVNFQASDMETTELCSCGFDNLYMKMADYLANRCIQRYPQKFHESDVYEVVISDEPQENFTCKKCIFSFLQNNIIRLLLEHNELGNIISIWNTMSGGRRYIYPIKILLYHKKYMATTDALNEYEIPVINIDPEILEKIHSPVNFTLLINKKKKKVLEEILNIEYIEVRDTILDKFFQTLKNNEKLDKIIDTVNKINNIIYANNPDIQLKTYKTIGENTIERKLETAPDNTTKSLSEPLEILNEDIESIIDSESTLYASDSKTIYTASDSEILDTPSDSKILDTASDSKILDTVSGDSIINLDNPRETIESYHLVDSDIDQPKLNEPSHTNSFKFRYLIIPLVIISLKSILIIFVLRYKMKFMQLQQQQVNNDNIVYSYNTPCYNI